ncbi:MAG TPA: type I restriction enzyme HsdR N-terminal domain-containing protein [Salinivirgaceae bacterium]|nr:type I restriction enzyme HsdR N-terminal domain-containing protein [Salinivirgaceae bacterium]
METLNFPSIDAEIKISDEGQAQIFDRIRRQWVALTPEEWVRQHVIAYLVDYLNYPAALMEVEKGLKSYIGKGRTDILVRNRKLQPLLLVECKAPSVKLNQKSLEQLFQYNLEYKAPILLLTNGLIHYCISIDFVNHDTRVLSQIPPYHSETSEQNI